MMPASSLATSEAVDLTIAIVSYNTRELLLDCLRSVYDHTKEVRFEIIVVDNHSQDGTVAALRAQYPGVRVIANEDNRGFSKGVNQALAVSAGRYFLMLNSDTLVRPHALDRMAACLDRDPTIGAVGCQQWTGEGRLYQSCFPFPSLRDHLCHAALFRRWFPKVQAAIAAGRAIDCRRSQDVDWINGACLMVRRHLLEECGGLDEGFFMYFEDVDLCRAIRWRGYRIRHLAEAHIVHLVGGSSGRGRERLNVEWELSRIRYVEKRFPPVTRWVMKAWIAAGAIVRLLRTFGNRVAAQGESRDACLSVLRRLWGRRGHDLHPWCQSRTPDGKGHPEGEVSWSGAKPIRPTRNTS